MKIRMAVAAGTAELVRPGPGGGQQGAAGSRRHRADTQSGWDAGTGPGRPGVAVETSSTTRNREQTETTALALPHAKSLMARVTVRTEWAGIEIQPLITQKWYDEAIHRITEYQQDLKQIKREAMYAEWATRVEGTQARTAIRQPGGLSQLMSGGRAERLRRPARGGDVNHRDR